MTSKSCETPADVAAEMRRLADIVETFRSRRQPRP